ncbi:hypothetical protein ETA_24030 [Erwinia tasmaniensis Et1/99]|uniref:Uncharacterized protein n=1 Tax=Erwinia tasmaniensis (strain DSM 17950 / CFBP 7177 / CIP 109463 / NCPPB 4357 / Et1/99) TaxID=465817 RepID=B2VBH6_ERWT9|nr:hypothetical protein ETA_24030 [Erwinia tasmaniensis Et1/99]
MECRFSGELPFPELISCVGVMIIISHSDWHTLAALSFSRGDFHRALQMAISFIGRISMPEDL